jgi:hypothetical protein
MEILAFTVLVMATILLCIMLYIYLYPYILNAYLCLHFKDVNV